MRHTSGHTRAVQLAMLLCVLAPTLTGCVAVAAGAGLGMGVAYIRGQLEADLDATPRQAVAAAERALNELGIPVLSQRSDEREGEVVGRTAGGDRVRIRVALDEEATKPRSRVRIRVGTFGDETLSRLIFDRMRQAPAGGIGADSRRRGGS